MNNKPSIKFTNDFLRLEDGRYIPIKSIKLFYVCNNIIWFDANKAIYQLAEYGSNEEAQLALDHLIVLMDYTKNGITDDLRPDYSCESD